MDSSLSRCGGAYVLAMLGSHENSCRFIPQYIRSYLLDKGNRWRPAEVALKAHQKTTEIRSSWNSNLRSHLRIN